MIPDNGPCPPIRMNGQLSEIKKRVLVAMSGGVDSATAAALLRRQGHEVEGVTMKLSPGVCCDIGSAQAVCKILGIPHRVLDLQAEFEGAIVNNFTSEYRRGRTPNPCIRCNDLIKFQVLLVHAREQSFDYLATGHYARIENDAVLSRCILRKGIDPSKDQSYFLYRLTQEQMSRVLFPLGTYKKTEVRKVAAQLGLPAAERPESQEICFIPDDNYRSFLRVHAPEAMQTGEIVLTDGTIVGKHDGIAFFTIGQRRKLGVAAGERLYVVRIDPATNRVVLGKHSELETTEMFVSDANWILFDTLRSPQRVSVKIRYRSPLVPAVVEPSPHGRHRVVFDTPVAGVCPGQSAVFYREESVIGGGIITGA